MKSFVLLVGVIFSFVTMTSAQVPGDIRQGSLFPTTKKGEKLDECPLKSTAVKAEISGSIARVNVSQEFVNNFTEPIEAIYTFPLSHNGAVDSMTMRIGERTIRGVVMKKAEARKVYETARDEGRAASLLDQDRPNIFTQSVANIMPGERIIIEISYVETLKIDDGSYEFVFPMTVAPRYEPADSPNRGVNEDVPESRPGHDISIEVNLNAGVPVEEIRSGTHRINSLNLSANTAKITLENEKTIPNKDFVLRYDVICKRLEDAVIATRGANGGFFGLILSPPERMSSADMTPKEIVFVLDTSGSMQGAPIETAKASMKMALDGLYPDDTFNLITFAGDTAILFDRPMPATRVNLDAAQAFLSGQRSKGGTEMMKAVKAALEPSDAKDHMRIVCFMTDGEVGNDMEIIAEVQKHPNARVFSFGIGDSVNRFLLDGIAKEGRGEAQYVLDGDDGPQAAKRFHERIRNPYLTDISIDWGGLPVTGVYPKRIPDLFGANPIVIYGRYGKAVAGKIRLNGKIGGLPFERDIAIDLPGSESGNGALASLWARTKVEELMSKSWDPNAEESRPGAAVREQITKLGVDYQLMTQYTSFVAVEEREATRTKGGKRIKVPGYAPAGTAIGDEGSGSGGVGTGNGSGLAQMPARAASNVSSSPIVSSNAVTLGETNFDPSPPPKAVPRVISGGVVNGKAVNLPVPTYPAAGKAVNASGSVTVQVTIDESGRVISSGAVSGHPLLRAAAEKAALAANFSPTMLSGVPVKVSGVIVYNFTGSNGNVPAKVGTPQVSVSLSESGDAARTNAASGPPKLSPEDLVAAERRANLAAKLHVWLYDLLMRFENGDVKPSDGDDRYYDGGKVRVEVRVVSLDAAAMDRLRAAGLEIASFGNGMVVIGQIKIGDVGKLAELSDVFLVLPRLQ